MNALTDREHQVLALLADGHDRADIATKLVLSEHTIRIHIRKLYAKLDARTAAQAVSVAYQRGLLAVDAAIEVDMAIVRSARQPGWRLALIREEPA